MGDDVFVEQYRECCLDAAGTGQIVALDETVALWTFHRPLLGNGFDDSKLVVCQEPYQFFILHGVPVYDMTDYRVGLFVAVYVLLSLI